MAFATTLATGVGAAIGGKYDAARDQLIFAGFYGYVSTINLATFQYQPTGAGYSNPEDVALTMSASGTPILYVTDRVGTLLRLDPLMSLNRSSATVVVSGLTAPQQMAVTDSGDSMYLVEYLPPGAGPGRLLHIDLTPGNLGATTPILNDVMEGVGVVVGAAGGGLYITEQAGGGRLSQIDPASKTRVKVVAANLPAPFFLSWRDAARTQLLVPLRDPSNRIMQVDFGQLDSTGNPRVTRLLDGVPWRPSSVTVLPGGQLVVFADREVTEYDLASGAHVTTPRGMGGGGQFFDPRFGGSGAPVPTLLMSSDMTGLYLSTNGGGTWQLQDGRTVMGYDRFSAVFSPSQPGQLLAAHPTQGLRVGVPNSADPSGMTWKVFSPPLVVGGQPVDLHVYASEPTAAAYSPTGAALLLGTRTGLYVLNSGAWTHITSATTPTGAAGSITDIVAVQWAPNGWAFAADIDHVLWSTDSGSTWHVLEQAGSGAQSLPPRPLGGSYAAGTSRVLALAGGSDPRSGAFVLYAAVPSGSQQQQPTTAGVYRCEVGPGATSATPPPWLPMLTSSVLQYRRLTVPAGNADTLYAGVVGDPNWMVYRGTYQPSSNSMTAVPIYDGFSNNPMKYNVISGWIDEAEPHTSLGFGFGGPANGLACDTTNGSVAAYVNAGFVDVSTNATGSSQSWQQIYSQLVPTAAGRRWRTNGSDVTSVWHYHVHPQDSSLHFLANTDISLSRSEDEGDTWVTSHTPC
jgi:hypothetical protein